MNTIREEIILEVMTRAAVIRSDGDPQEYNTDCGLNVLRARPSVDPGELPCVVVWPQDETAENAYGRSKHVMPVQVEGLAVFGSDDPSVAGERILGDLIKCFTSPLWDRTRPGEPTPENYLDSIVYVEGGVEAPKDGDISVAAKARFNITYWTAIGDPYNQ
ncbi:MAG: hypothetical protein JW943_14655 [Deltaproteobacteria bacterium]|nr:hypothetical protein [Deltaproteobacteria bacterium]